MSKPRKDEPLKMPRYRGGEEALRNFISSNLKYPEEALENKVEGDVEVSYDVDGLGRISNVKVLQSLGFGCDEEVIRLVKLLKFEKAFNKGRRVTSHKKLKVNFKLPAQKQEQKIQYQMTSSEKKTKETSTKRPVTYGYTIKFD